MEVPFVLKVDIGVDETGNQYVSIAIDYLSMAVVGDDQPVLDSNCPRLRDLLAIEDADVLNGDLALKIFGSHEELLRAHILKFIDVVLKKKSPVQWD